jgi:hypothetical protein
MSRNASTRIKRAISQVWNMTESYSNTISFIDCDSYIIYNIAKARWFPAEVQLMETSSRAKRYFQKHNIKLVDLREERKWVSFQT